MPQLSPVWVWQRGWKKELCRGYTEASRLKGECKRGEYLRSTSIRFCPKPSKRSTTKVHSSPGLAFCFKRTISLSASYLF